MKRSLVVNMKKVFSLSLVTTLAAASFFQGSTATVSAESTAATPDTIYYNGKVITMDENETIAEAVAVKDGKITSVGSTEEVKGLEGNDTRKVDLDESVMLPGLYDTHSHFPFTGYIGTVWVDLQSPPAGPVEDINNLIAELKEEAENTAAGEWIYGFGYDQTLLAEGRHPTRQDLDKVSTEHPIFITHTSGHMGVANSLALEESGITKDTPNPPGGVIEKDSETGELTGLLQESATIYSGYDVIEEEENEIVKQAVYDYASQGVTTSIIAGGSYDQIKQYNQKGLLPFRFTVMSRSDGAPMPAEGDEWVRPGSIKITHDGSIQGYTGYLGEPYYIQPENETDFRGFPSQSREELTERVVRLHKEGYSIAIHANGDAAIDDVLHAYRTAQEMYPRKDTRHRIEHSQMARTDQIDEMKELGVTPSYFVSHTYYWGDSHRDIFMGPERAANMSPLQWTIDRDVKFSIHLDSHVVPMSPLQAVWSAVNRLSRSDKVIGPEQRITPMEALKAVTIDAAWQNFEEDIKGSIEEGKFADFAILEEDPLTVDSEAIRDIKVSKTIVNDEIIYEKVNADDIEDHWAVKDIEKAYRNGWFKGYPDGTFKPDKALTRMQTASLFTRVLNLDRREAVPFKDVKGIADETIEELEAAYAGNIIRGYEDNTFKPFEDISRAHIALMISRVYEEAVGEAYKPDKETSFPDIGHYDQETQNAIMTLKELGIADGDNGEFKPDETTTRAHAAKMLGNLNQVLQELKK